VHSAYRTWILRWSTHRSPVRLQHSPKSGSHSRGLGELVTAHESASVIFEF